MKNNLHHFIQNIHNLYVTFQLSRGAFFKIDFYFYLYVHVYFYLYIHVYVCVYIYIINLILTLFDFWSCVDFILFLANSISTQNFQQFDTFCIIGITQNSVIWFGLQTEWLTSAWNAECRENKIWLERAMKLIQKFFFLIVTSVDLN